jgi:hypothetical protein
MLAIWILASGPSVHASTFSYGYQLLNTQDGRHFFLLTDGYCIFVHKGPFNRICFEAGPGLHFAPFAFDIHAQVVMHHIWLRPHIFGLYTAIGPMFSVYPNAQFGFRISAGFHFYLIAPAIEFQLVGDTQGHFEPRLLLQFTFVIPTGSINFATGNAGL